MSKVQQLNKCKEIDTRQFADEKFAHTCPRCGFKFNGKKNNVSLELEVDRPADDDEREKGI